jgi:hypothetical protein
LIFDLSSKVSNAQRTSDISSLSSFGQSLNEHLVTTPVSRYTAPMAKRKLLLVLFTNEPCKRNHAFMHAVDLSAHGHEVRILLEGDATRCLADREGRFGMLFDDAAAKGLVVGACKTAAVGCASTDPMRNMTSRAVEQGIPLLDGMDGHASITSYIDDGFELIIY